MAKMVIKMKDGTVKKFSCGSVENGTRIKVLAVAKYHYIPLKTGDIYLREIESIDIVEDKNEKRTRKNIARKV